MIYVTNLEMSMTLTDKTGRDVSNISAAFIVLMSSDEREYCVSSTLLRLASGFFRKRLQYSYTNENSRVYDIPVLNVPEPANVIGFIARYVDPTSVFGKRWATTTIRTLGNILKAAEKYEIFGLFAFVESYVTIHWSMLNQHPVELYGFILQARFDRLERRAAHETLKLQSLADAKGHQILSNAELLTLCGLHETRIRVLSNVVWRGCRIVTTRREDNVTQACKCGAYCTDEAVNKFNGIAERVTSYLRKRPLGDAMWTSEFWTIETVGMDRCGFCFISFFDTLAVITHLNSDEMAKALYIYRPVR